jgi:hypothetical protein
MCFSATASFTAAVVVGGVGAATLPLVRDRRELLFAGLPLVFGVHQFLEGVIWQQMDASGDAVVRSPTVIAWLCIAWLILPVWVPISVSLFEADPGRRAWMLRLAALGALIGTYLFVSSFLLSATVTVNQNHLQYQLPLHPGWLLALPYLAATCLPLLLSSRRFVNYFGVGIVVSMSVSAAVAAKQFSSVWCFFAAVLSVGLFVHYVLERQDRRVLSAAAS